MAKRISLREFQESLVRRLAEAQAGDRRALLGLQAGSENWLIDLTDSGEILPVPPLSPVPLTRPWFSGVANVRGTLFGVVDFSAFQQGAPISRQAMRAWCWSAPSMASTVQSWSPARWACAAGKTSKQTRARPTPAPGSPSACATTRTGCG